MQLTQLINENLVNLNLKSSTKEEVIKELVSVLDENDRLLDRDALEKAVFEREKTFSTGIGMGVAIPHGKSSGVKQPSLVFGRKLEGIDFESTDGKPAKIFFLIAVPENSDAAHLKLLSKLSRSLMHEEIRNKLLEAKEKHEIIDILNQGGEL
ncbi:PTS sugar transporter subunit IIA [Caldisalinibacter kiritimatiensis]|uniref:PTS system, fructose-specific IIA component n=1 Tax=Caldisalinibacter kiritimatiensis TaxID=1304284 RepID=R1AVC4_9FIRM|nr:PTS sugar transporter subunit IIA [Caldisalinibacter kiritimatiensis]EOD00602.1 PTS system, fructose-specific IIA component [Caldisalinibacter kiritimatiensis]